ncbi:MAG: lytic polysaccharide monooxygenase [Thermoleophilia bacterium]
MKKTRLAGAVLAALIGAATIPALAMAHGSMSDPPSRLHGCAFSHKDDPACVAAFTANPQAVYDWMELNISAAGDQHQALIPDGQLCSAGRAKYAAFDVARAWPVTDIAPGADGKYSFTWTSSAPHATKYYRLYLAKASYDPSHPLTWADLEQVYDSGAIPAAATNTFRVALPARTGHQVLYTVWQRSDSLEAFYACNDIREVAADGTTPAPTPAPTPPPTPPPTPTPTPTPDPGTNLVVTQTVASDWGEGYCKDVRVTNNGPATVTWTVPVPVDGMVSTLWSAKAANGATTGTLQVSGESWNSTLAAGASTTFGYCGMRMGTPAPPPPPAPAPPPPPAPTPVPVPTPVGNAAFALTITSDWASGFCTDVKVTTTSASPITWQGQLAIGGTTTSLWNAVASGTSGTVTVKGEAWNPTVSASSPTTFGYCANRPVSSVAASMPVITAAAGAVAAVPPAPSVATTKAAAKVKVVTKAKSRVRVQTRPTRVAAHHH